MKKYLFAMIVILGSMSGALNAEVNKSEVDLKPVEMWLGSCLKSRDKNSCWIF